MKFTLTLLTALLLMPLAAFNAAASQPNIVFIISDDQGAGDYGFMGHPMLYDFESDPNEEINVTSEHPEIMNALRIKLDAHYKPEPSPK
jgi:hypothetical protein